MMRITPTLTLCLSVLALTGCRFSMQTGSGSFAVDMHTGPEASITETVAKAAPPASTQTAKSISAYRSPQDAVVSQKSSSATPEPHTIQHAGWRPSSSKVPLVPGTESEYAVPAVIEVAAAAETVSLERLDSTGGDGESVTADTDLYPLNLTTALQLAGGNNLQIALAGERIQEAISKLNAAEVMWLPSLNAGVGFNSHTGNIQATQGEVIEVDRQSVFVGGGPVLGGGPLAGGSGGPLRLVANLSPVDAWFEPLAAQQTQVAAEADHSAAYNDTLYRVTVAWLDLQEAQSRVAIANEAIEHSQKLAGLTREFANAGVGLEADALRADADLSEQRRRKLEAEEQRDVGSAELARLLRLPVETQLYATDAQPVPMEIVAADVPLSELLSQGMNYRPELLRQRALANAAYQRTRQEQLRPWLPKLQAGMSAGGFAGGANSEFGNLRDRVDIDALAVWELQNLGFGNAARLAERESQQRQANLTLESFQDQVAVEIAQAHARVRHRRAQIDVAAAQLKSAEDALPLNFKGIEGGELRPIEAQQAISSLVTARRRYLRAIVSYNEAQFSLLRSVGEPPQSK
jgi:outer membrane protein TolC